MNTTQGEDGLGLIEIVVSMFMLALLAMAFLPVLTQGLLASVENARLATATQAANASVEAARAVPFTACAGVLALAGVSTVPDGRGGTLTVERSVSCDASNSDPERITVVVKDPARPGVELVRVTTFVNLDT